MTLHILPPLHYGYRCQAAIAMTAKKPTQQYILQPLPKWRYCSWCASPDENSLSLCERHRRIADIRGTTRLLPKLIVWVPPVRQGIDSKHAEW